MKRIIVLWIDTVAYVKMLSPTMMKMRQVSNHDYADMDELFMQLLPPLLPVQHVGPVGYTEFTELHPVQVPQVVHKTITKTIADLYDDAFPSPQDLPPIFSSRVAEQIIVFDNTKIKKEYMLIKRVRAHFILNHTLRADGTEIYTDETILENDWIYYLNQLQLIGVIPQLQYAGIISRMYSMEIPYAIA